MASRADRFRAPREHGPMKVYADSPARRVRQLLGDFLVVAWVLLWAWLATRVHDATMHLAVPGREIDEAAGAMAGQLRDAGGAVADVPLVGSEVGDGFEGAGAAADRLAAAGRTQVDAVEQLALWLALAVALTPVLIVLAVYLPPRIRFVRRASAGRRLLDSAADLDLFALRAMANQPLHVLDRVSADPVRAWREGDREVVRRLAALELREVGIRPR